MNKYAGALIMQITLLLQNTEKYVDGYSLDPL
jgi:hypothetical protein